MQKIQFYLVPNRLTVTTNLVGNGYFTEYRKVYTRKIKVFKGIDNAFEVDVRNAEQQRQPVVGKTVKARFFDLDNKILFTATGTAIPAKLGIMKFTITKDQIETINPQQLYLRLSLDDGANESILYSDAQFDISAAVELLNGYNELGTDFIEEATVFNYEFDRKMFVSEILNFGHQTNEDPAVSMGKTIDVYAYPKLGDGFVGRIQIQAANDKSTALGNTWDTLGYIDVTPNYDSENVYVRVSGSYRFVRFMFPKFQNDGVTRAGLMSKIKIKSSYREASYEADAGVAGAIYTQPDYILNGGTATDSQ